MIVDTPKLNPVMYHWNWCEYCKGTSLGTILHHLEMISKGESVNVISPEDRKVLEQFPLMTDTLQGVRP